MRRCPAVVLAVAALIGLTTDVAGQDQDPPDQEPPDTAVQDTTPPGPALGYVPPALSLVVTAGQPGEGEAQTHAVDAYRTDLSGAVLDSAVLSRSLTVRGGIRAAFAGELSLGPRWAVRLGLGAAVATLETGYSGQDDAILAGARALTPDGERITVLSAETTLRYRIPSQRRFRPYLEMGTGVSRWSIDGEAGLTRFEGLAAVGAVVPLSDRLSARVHAASRSFRTPVATATAGDTLASSSALTLISRPSTGATFVDGARELMSLLSLEVGLSVDLGSAAGRAPTSPEPGDPAGTSGTPSPPGR